MSAVVNPAEIPVRVRVGAVSLVLHVVAYNADGDEIQRQPVDLGEVGRARFPRLQELISEHERRIEAAALAEVQKMLAAQAAPPPTAEQETKE